MFAHAARQEIAKEYMVQITVHKSHLGTFQRAGACTSCLRTEWKCDVNAHCLPVHFIFLSWETLSTFRREEKFNDCKERNSRQSAGTVVQTNKPNRKRRRESPPYPVFVPVFGRQPPCCRQYWPLRRPLICPLSADGTA